MLLMNSTEHHPIVAVAPFSPQVLPGAAAPANKYGFAGDISDAGALPALVTIMNARFHLTDNVDVLVAADLDGAWVILPAGEELLPVPGAVVNTEQRRTCMVMPVPHQYAAIMLEAYANGSLTWRWD